MADFLPPGSIPTSPAAQEPAGAAYAARLPGERRILVVDDEISITESLSAIFTHTGYTVQTAQSAEQAIEIMANWEPDLAILDVMLPRMNGIELAVVLRENHPRCRLVLFSGNAGTQVIAEEAAKRGNFFEILAKPVHPLFMLDYVASLLADHRPERHEILPGR